MIAGFLIFLYLFLITPLHLGALFSLESGQAPRGVIGILIWGIPLHFPFSLNRDESGALHLESDRKHKKSAHPEKNLSRGIAVLKAFQKADKAKALLFRSLHFSRGDIFWQLHLENAAETALLCALFQFLSALFPAVHLRMQPAFQGKTALRARCMIECRLGMLSLTALLGFISYRLAAKKEEKPWITPSGI